MPNPHYNNMHGADRKHPGAAKEPGGSKPKSGSDKTANWPGVPGKTQGRARNAGSPTSGWKGQFEVKKIGL